MTEKLKVSREVAEAIEAAKKDMDDELLLIYHAEGRVTSESFWAAKKLVQLNQLSPYQLAIALIIGYEVEPTPHEIIKADYENALNHRKTTHNDYRERFFDGYLVGVEDTLATLGIAIEGVNDNETI